ncbi:MFS transporter [Niveibacterium microcysteis]|uniref:MFS transporter n=1 Tax=Niveibacterium microcysteis TaxID=2811415 RepID=A0ABX7M6X5_9RHOO|nr:MFS transporter [Niveibacterium microcysteis]QSI77510.1 MFS transporter [Niveibacterium microcysteis]
MRHPRLVLFSVCCVALMSTVGVALPYPILSPLFIDGPVNGFTHWAGLNPKLLLGIAIALNPFGILLGSLVLGPMSDRYGRRRIMLATLTLAILGYALSAFALVTENFPLFALARFATGLCEGNAAIARAIAADLHPQIDKTRSFSMVNASLYIGWLVGPLLGGFLMPLGGWVPFVVAAAMMLPALVLLAWLVPNTGAKADPGGRGWVAFAREQHAFRLLEDPAVRRVFWLQLAFTFGLNGFYEFYPLWLVEFARLGPTGISWVTAGMCLLMTLMSALVWPRIGQRFRPLAAARSTAWVVAACFVVLATGWSTLGIVVIVLIGVPLSIYSTSMPVHWSQSFDQHGQGAVMGLLSTTFCLANVAVALVGAALILLDTRLVLALSAVACGTAAWRLGGLLRRGPPAVAAA